MMLDEFKIELIHQVPRTPYSNLLDLGFWCSLQSKVEKEHFMKRSDVDASAASVERAWNRNDDVIGRVWGRLKNVLALIVEGKGGNNLVETKRGKKFRGLDVS